MISIDGSIRGDCYLGPQSQLSNHRRARTRQPPRDVDRKEGPVNSIPPSSIPHTSTTSDDPRLSGGTIAAKPGSGRRRPPRTPKGRQVDPQALADVRALLGTAERRRDLLIEHLHLIQDRFGHL